jgi:hypothetical protein
MLRLNKPLRSSVPALLGRGSPQGAAISSRINRSPVVRWFSDGADKDHKKVPPVTFEDISRAHYRILSGIKRTVSCEALAFSGYVCFIL